MKLSLRWNLPRFPGRFHIIRITLLTLLILPIPFFLVQPPSLYPSPAPLTIKEKRTSDRGLYITAWSAQSKRKMEYIQDILKKHKLNTLVVDAKEMISRPLLELLKEKKLNESYKVEPNPWLKELTDQLHTQEVIVTARLVVFKDDHLVISRPDLAIYLNDGGIYRDRKGGRWANPYSAEVRLYNALIAECAAASGVDEVQFDYIRFPAEGNAQNIVLPHANEKSRVEMINQFLAEVKKRVEKYNVSLAVDIFGVTAWQSQWDVETLGQSLEAMAQYLDVLSPMFYPSHFHRGYEGYGNPGSYPYYFVNTGVKKALSMLISAEAKTQLVPWIQGFNLKSPNFGPGYIAEQIKACQDEGVNRFLIWNAGNNYDFLPADL